MAGRIGRSVALTWDGAAVAGVREKGIALAGEPIDVTDDDSAGWRTLLTEAGENQVTISISGVTKDAVLRTAWFAGDRTNVVTLTYPSGGGTLTGTFYLASYSEAEPYNGAATFEAELQSSGVVTFA